MPSRMNLIAYSAQPSLACQATSDGPSGHVQRRLSTTRCTALQALRLAVLMARSGLSLPANEPTSPVSVWGIQSSWRSALQALGLAVLLAGAGLFLPAGLPSKIGSGLGDSVGLSEGQ